MLVELRGQRDMALELNEQWTGVQADHTKRLDELEVNQMTIDTQEETIAGLREEVLSLKKGQRSANQPRPRQPTEPLPRQSTENHTRRESFTLSGNGHHKSFKFPDPPIFTGEDEPT